MKERKGKERKGKEMLLALKVIAKTILIVRGWNSEKRGETVDRIEEREIRFWSRARDSIIWFVGRSVFYRTLSLWGCCPAYNRKIWRRKKKSRARVLLIIYWPCFTGYDIRPFLLPPNRTRQFSLISGLVRGSLVPSFSDLSHHGNLYYDEWKNVS